VKVRRIIARNGSPSSDSSLYDAESLLSEADALTTAMRGLADSSKSPFNTIWKKKEERCKAEVGQCPISFWTIITCSLPHLTQIPFWKFEILSCGLKVH